MAEKQSRPAPRPGNRPSPAVYRRRRIVVLIGTLIVAGTLVWGSIAIVGLFAGPGEKNPVAEPVAPSATVENPSPASPSPSDTCRSDDIVVVAETEKGSYGAEENPVLVMRIENKGKVPCGLNVGTSVQEFTVMSGADRIFSTSDCRADAQDYLLTIAAGAAESAKFTWMRDRSAPGCGSVAAKPRPGTYVFTAKLGDVSSNRSPFLLK